MSTLYTYIFVREDLTISQQIVQASHAALEAGYVFENPGAPTNIVLIGVKAQDELKQTSSYLDEQGIKHKIFFEPDFDNGYTAIATQPLGGDQRKPLRHYNIHRGANNVDLKT